MKRVVITGIGVVSPLGIGLSEFWQNLCAGTIAIDRIKALDPSGLACQVAGEVPSYKINDFVPKSYRKATKVMARDIELAVIAAKDAFTSAGIKSKADEGGPEFDSARFGCNIGAGLISAELDELTAAMDKARTEPGAEQIDWNKWGNEGMQQLTPLWLLKYLPNMLACHVTIIHGLTGPSNNITCAEASGHLSIGEAFRTIQRGKADLAIAGGAESMLNPMAMFRQQLLGRLNGERNDDPKNALRPFSPDAKGTVPAEGGALLILEEFEHAKARGATIYAEIAGFASRQDPFDPVQPDPEGRSYASAVRAALKEANAAPADVDVVVPHGLGIPHHDRSELTALRQVFADDLGKPAMCPIKGQTGTPAAGCALDAATAAMTLHTGQLPPAVNTDNELLNVSKTVRESQPKLAVSSIFSLGGQTAALVLRKV